MTEVVRARDGAAVALRPCPSWCTESRHFGEGDTVYADDGYHHYGTETEVPTAYPSAGVADGDPTVVRAVLKSWTYPLDAAPGPARKESSGNSPRLNGADQDLQVQSA